MVAVAPSSSGIVAVMSASCTAPSGTLESGASVFVDGELGSDDFLLDGEESRCNKPMSERSGRADVERERLRWFFSSRPAGGEICPTGPEVTGRFKAPPASCSDI